MNIPIEERISQARLGETTDTFWLEGRNAHRLMTQEMASQAVRHLDLLTYDLDPALYDQKPFLDAVKALAIRSRFSRIRIILQDNERVQRDGHRLIELARRLTSSIEIRRPCADYVTMTQNFLVVDETGYIKREFHTRYEGEANMSDRLTATRLSELFEEIWQSGEPDSDLRRLYL